MPEMLTMMAWMVPLAGALLVRVVGDKVPPRSIAVAAALAALVCSLPGASLDALSHFAMVLYAGLTVVVLVAAPKKDSTVGEQAGTLLILAGTLAVYATDNLAVLVGGWIVSMLPLWVKPKESMASWLVPRLMLGVGTVALGGAVVLIAMEAQSSGIADVMSISALQGVKIIDNPAVYGLILLAILTRKGVVPFQSWLPAMCEQGSLLQAGLFVNGHLGAFLVARLVVPLLPNLGQDGLAPISILALVTAAYTSLLALTERRPRRLVGLLLLSQSSFILAGVESGTQEGFAGALLFWLVVSLSTTVLFVVLRALEARLGGWLRTEDYLGLGMRAPRLAAFFVVAAVAVVGMPGTLGFAAEDLLLHGTLESHRWVGLILPFATAMNAFSLLRLFARLFLGRYERMVPAIPDALPRERWVLTACLLVLVGLGVMPQAAMIFAQAKSTALHAMLHR
ncbi:MAG: hypothetical protein JNK87_08810 [Bryobacterales bacterium]|nr:hypothetical protein [Bryobacterales bacterium]